jgi:hypothetical protein
MADQPAVQMSRLLDGRGSSSFQQALFRTTLFLAVLDFAYPASSIKTQPRWTGLK